VTITCLYVEAEYYLYSFNLAVKFSVELKSKVLILGENTVKAFSFNKLLFMSTATAITSILSFSDISPATAVSMSFSIRQSPNNAGPYVTGSFTTNETMNSILQYEFNFFNAMGNPVDTTDIPTTAGEGALTFPVDGTGDNIGPFPGVRLNQLPMDIGGMVTFTNWNAAFRQLQGGQQFDVPDGPYSGKITKVGCPIQDGNRLLSFRSYAPFSKEPKMKIFIKTTGMAEAIVFNRKT
jgi:hypothetical protein